MLKSNPSHTTKLEESKTYEVYFIESTDHWYVGCTTRTTPVRFAQHLAPSSDAPIGKLAKQGIEFTWSVLERGAGNYADRIQAEQRWYEEKLYTDGRRTLNGQPPAGGKSHWQEGAELLLSTDFGQALARAAILEMAESALKDAGGIAGVGYQRNADGTYTKMCTPAQELAEA